MAYAAVISLKRTILGLLESSRISLVSSTRKILRSAHSHTTSLQKALESFKDSSSKRLDALDAKIRDAAHKLEDILETYELNLLNSDLDLDQSAKVRDEIASFLENVKSMEDEYRKVLLTPDPDPVPEEDDDDDDVDNPVSSNADFEAKMVGYESDFTKLRDFLLERMRPNDMCFFSYVGEVGTGRSIIAKTIFEEERRCFDCAAWVTIAASNRQRFKGILTSIFGQVNNANVQEEEEEDDDNGDIICRKLYEALEGRRYLIVLDDVRDAEVLAYLKRSFPDQSNGSLVLIITNSVEIAESVHSSNIFRARVGYLEESSWYFLKLAVFGPNVAISPELEEAGKRIDGNCGGRRMALAKTLLYLIKTEKTLEHWSKLAEDKGNPIFMVEDEISEIYKINTERRSHNWDMDDQRKDYTVKLILKWIDFSDSVAKIKRKMYPKRFFSKMQTISLWGMAGIGKSTFANKIIQDESILCHFDHCVWLNLGLKYHPEEILIDILAQIYPNIPKMQMKEDEKLSMLCEHLLSKRCLIVLDDVCSLEPIYHLRRLFPEMKGRVLVTTRLEKVAKVGEDDICYEMHLLDKEQSWSLLRQKVFGEGLCPVDLEKSGRKIAENCDGLPLLLVKVAYQLLQMDKNIECWNYVASEKESSVFMNAHDEISKALHPSYKSLPQHLKPCFLYVGVFRKCYDISASKLTNMLIAEGFVEHNIAECLNELASRSLVMVKKRDTNLLIKRCRLHSVFWHLCNNEAIEAKFFHAINKYDDCSIEKMEGQRRLCVRNSILLGLKELHDTISSVTSAHSLLCVNPLHQYQVPICFDLRLLRVMDALTIRLYEFPAEVVKLTHLRYLALTCNGKLPTSVSELWKLQYLIVSRFMNIKTSENSSVLPMEIWDMKELEHLQIMGGCLPNPKHGDSLPKLSALLDVSGQSCTKEVLERIPNLKKLGIRIELSPGDDQDNPICYLNHISCLSHLESLKCVVLNPQIRCGVVSPPPPVFPSRLKKLSLSGFGYHWENMSTIGKLQNLEVLKLKNYAFRGQKWTIDRLTDFEKLKFLLIEDTDLVQWDIRLPVFRQLEGLTFKHCYKLQKFPNYLPISSFRKMEIVDCNPLTVSWAEKMRKQLVPFPVESHLSWIGENRPRG